MRHLPVLAGLSAATLAVLFPAAANAQLTTARPVEPTSYWGGGSPTQAEINGVLTTFVDTERQIGSDSRLTERQVSSFRREARYIRIRIRSSAALSSRDQFGELSRRVSRLHDRVQAATSDQR